MLHEATRDGCINVIKWLVSNGYNINETDDQGQTPLHIACYYGYLSIVEYLIFMKANCHKKDMHCRTAFSVALSMLDFISTCTDGKITDIDKVSEYYKICYILTHKCKYTMDKDDDMTGMRLINEAHMNSIRKRTGIPLYELCGW